MPWETSCFRIIQHNTTQPSLRVTPPNLAELGPAKALAKELTPAVWCSGQSDTYITSLNRIVKVLDFVKSGGPGRTELRTFRWEVTLYP